MEEKVGSPNQQDDILLDSCSMNGSVVKRVVEEDKTLGKATRYFDSTFVVGFVLLLNLVCFSLFQNVRLDFTSSGAYTISKVSRLVVKDLSDPLSIKVFFSGNIPAPHNTLERYVRDLLGAYSSHANKNFSYTFFDCSEYKNNRKTLENLQEADRNGIESVQIQSYEQGEMKIARVYMGMSLEYAGSISRVYFNNVPPEELEYKITSLIHKMSAKKSKMQALSAPIQVVMHVSGQLEKKSDLFGVKDWSEFVELAKTSIQNLSERLYGKIEFSISPQKSMLIEDLKSAGVTALRMTQKKDFAKEDLCYIFLKIIAPKEEQGVEGKVIQRDLLGVGLGFSKGQAGLVYNVVPSSDISAIVESGIDSILEMSDRISYLTDKGCISLGSAPSSMMFQMQQQQTEGEVLKKLLSRWYAFQEVTSKQLNFLSSKSLVIAGSTEAWKEEELFYLDQFLLGGGSLIIFHDGLLEKAAPGGYGSSVKENITGLEMLLKHYGVVVQNEFVMDERCFVRRDERGNRIQEIREHQIPLLRREQFPSKFLPLKNIEQIFLYKPTAMHLSEEVQSNSKVRATPLFVSSEKSWVSKEVSPTSEMGGAEKSSNIRANVPMGYMLEGKFTSYFQEVPKGLGMKDTNFTEVPFLRESKQEGKIALVGSSHFIKSFALEEQERYPNTKVFMNLVDYVNGREEWIPLRTKNVFFRPLEDFANLRGIRSLFFSTYDSFKYISIFGLPLLIFFVGLLAYSSLKRRKDMIQARYQHV